MRYLPTSPRSTTCPPAPRRRLRRGRAGLLPLLLLAAASALGRPALADGDEPRRDRLGAFVGLGYLGSPGLHGAAFEVGLRYRPIRYLALGFDAGWGAEGRNPQVQDRWWLMPSIAMVLPLGPVQLDLGVGLGFGTTSGYRDWSEFAGAPFSPDWAYQFAPTLRAHATAIVPLTPRADLFLRFEASTLILEGNDIGYRVPNPNPEGTDRIWYGLYAGLHFGLL